MVKILQIVGQMHRAGMETLIMNIYRNIDRNKIQFDFCVHTDKEGEYDSEILKLGGNIHRLPEAKVFNLFKLNRAVDSFLRDHNNYAAIHVHYSCVGVFYFHYAKKYGIKNRIYHAHNSSRERGLKAYTRYCMEHLSVKQANHYLACSDLAAEYNFGKNSNFIYINNAIDVNRFRFNKFIRNKIRREYKIDDKLVCVHAGRFDIQKNHIFLIQVFEEAYKSNHSLYLFLLGDGPLRDQIMRTIEKMECRNNVKFLGNREDVEEIFFAADVFLLPSLYEGLPLTLVEAQASGLSCIVSNKVTTQAVINKEDVLMIPIDDKPLWANAINMNAEDYIGKSRIDKADNIIEAGFDAYSVAKKIQNIYLYFADYG